MGARAIMLQGTGSNVGKSLLVAGLARALTAARADGRPVQAAEHVEQRGGDGGWRRDRPGAGACRRAPARVAPSVHMNPVLLKPQSEIGAQIIVQGKVFGQANARAIPGGEARADAAGAGELRPAGARPISCWWKARAAPSEINLRSNDIANMGFARAADVPVVLVGRYRPGRGDREPGRHQGRARARGCQARRGLHRQQHARRSALFADGMVEIAKRHRLAGAWARAFLRGREGACRRRMPTISPRPSGARGEGRDQNRRAAPAAHRQFRRSRSAPRRAGRRAQSWCDAASRCPAMRPHRAAGVESDHRRPRRAARRGLGHRPRRACAARRARARALRRLSDARAQHRRPGRDRGPADDRSRASGLLDSTPR